MSYKHINWVRDHSKAKGSARLVLRMIATRVDENGSCYPSYRCLSRDTGLSPRTVQRAVKEIPLDELEIVDPGGSPKDGSRHSTKYRMTFGDHSQIDNSDSSQFHGDRCQNGHFDSSQINYLTAKAEQTKEQKGLTEQPAGKINGRFNSTASFEPNPKASALSHKKKAEKHAPRGRTWKLSGKEIDELEDRFPLLQVKELIRPAAAKCQESYPSGGPMRFGFFERYLENCQSDLDPPGLIEHKARKTADLAEAARDREQSLQATTEEPAPTTISPQLLILRRPELPPTTTEPEAQLENWKNKCPQLSSEIEQIFNELKATYSDWNAKVGKIFDKRCGELYDRLLRQFEGTNQRSDVRMGQGHLPTPS